MKPRVVWLFSPALDLLAFAAPVLLPLLLCAWLAARGLLSQPQGAPGWLVTVVLIDVAHVYATIYRVYPAELRRRPWLYGGAPAVCYALGVLAYAVSPLTFWRALAYLAVFHFVRQQYGWVALAGRRDRDLPAPRPGTLGAWLTAALPARLGRRLDGAAVYAGALYPLLWWHLHLPRRYHWFIAGDFADPVSLAPRWLLPLATVLWAAIGGLWLLRALAQGLSGGGWNATKLLVVIGTWATWYLGIVAWDSDVAFTWTNVVAHGVPYLLVVHRFHLGRRGRALSAAPAGHPRAAAGRSVALLLSFAAFYLPLALLSYVEEGVWDRLVWHDHTSLFPLAEVDLGGLALVLLVPLLSLPQATHYVLDAWIWRSGDQNPGLAQHLGL